MHVPLVSLMRSDPRSADEELLIRLFRSFDVQSQQTLLSFARFLSEQSSQSERTPEGQPEPVSIEPIHEPRPAQEGVIAAITRLRRTYPMLDAGDLLHQASSLMAAHVLRGRSAESVIDELEDLFAARFAAHRGKLR